MKSSKIQKKLKRIKKKFVPQINIRKLTKKIKVTKIGKKLFFFE